MRIWKSGGQDRLGNRIDMMSSAKALARRRGRISRVPCLFLGEVRLSVRIQSADE
jgi:hypothetical protein